MPSSFTTTLLTWSRCSARKADSSAAASDQVAKTRSPITGQPRTLSLGGGMLREPACTCSRSAMLDSMKDVVNSHAGMTIMAKAIPTMIVSASLGRPPSSVSSLQKAGYAAMAMMAPHNIMWINGLRIWKHQIRIRAISPRMIATSRARDIGGSRALESFIGWSSIFVLVSVKRRWTQQFPRLRSPGPKEHRITNFDVCGSGNYIYGETAPAFTASCD